ncbi:MAG TPA: YebC/PmpR family DNA-binding transcriptional regulator [Patescibacteria group bacterium]|nr:YebC/PmpR family DNA-binding transcriptional regulator [Patescibacteria group bacterium]
MSGHSKWSTIKHQKEATDIKRGKVFSKLAKAITLAAGEGTDPEKNFKLRLEVERAKQANMPKENIERAIAKVTGRGEGKLEEVVYEGYGPEGVAIIVEAATDNRNRTTADVKNIFERGGGSLSGSGAVDYQFKSMGLITVEKSSKTDEQILKIIDLGVEDVEEVSDALEIYVKQGKLAEIREQLSQANFKVLNAELVKQPKNEIKIINPAKANKVLKLMNSLHEHDDIQRVFANFNIPEEVLKQIDEV